MKYELSFKLNEIYKRAKTAKPNGSYAIYAKYKQELEALQLTPKAFETALIKLSTLLGV